MVFQPEKYRRVLIYRIGSLGDTLVALPILHEIARRFPDAERRLLTNFPVQAKAPAAAAILGESGLVHGYMRYSVGTRSLSALMQLRREIRSYNPDLLIYLMPRRSAAATLRDRIFFWFSGIRRAYGYPAEAELEYRYDSSTGLYESESSRLARCFGEFAPIDLDESRNWNLLISENEAQKALEFLASHAGRPMIVCAPGTKCQSNDWGAERWSALLERIHEQLPDHMLLMIGSASERDEFARIAESWKGEKANLCGSFSPRQLIPLLAACRLFLGTDSGPKHLAACAGTPSVCVFSARNLPGVWFPPGGKRNRILYRRMECENCRLEACVEKAKECILSISINEVSDAVGELLNLPGLRQKAREANSDLPILQV